MEKFRRSVNAKKSLSLFLALVLAVLSFVPLTVGAFAADEEEKGFLVYPTVRIAGARWNLWNNYTDTKNRTKIYDQDDGVPVSASFIAKKTAKLLPLFVDAMKTDDYDEYAHALADAVSEVYVDFVPDENGDPRNNSGREISVAEEDTKDEDGTYNPRYAYLFNNDWRLAPEVQADNLRTYIEQVLEVTGAEKINLYTRCESSSVALCYLEKYGCDEVASYFVDSQGSNGFLLASYGFSGEIEIDTEALARWLKFYPAHKVSEKIDDLLDAIDMRGLLISEPVLARLFLSPLSSVANSLTVRQLVKLLNKVIPKIKDIAVPEILMNSYGRLLSYWTVVDNDHFDKAREFLLSDSKWDNFRARVDDYHNKCQVRNEEILQSCVDKGMKMEVIARYGYENYPLIKGWKELSDSEVATADQSYGATCATIGETLSDEYIAEAKENGTDKYISADRQIDASTALFPDKTWFVKYAGHDYLSGVITDIHVAFLRSGGELTVWDDPSLPQYTVVLDEATDEYVPLTADNADGSDPFRQTSLIRTKLDLLKEFFEMLIRRVKLFFGKFKFD